MEAVHASSVQEGLEPVQAAATVSACSAEQPEQPAPCIGTLVTSGGRGQENMCMLTYERLDSSAIVDMVVEPCCGAASVFLGTTRNSFEGKEVVRLEYEAYVPMALKELDALCQGVRELHAVHRIAVFHRLGVVPVTEASVIIAVASPHRRAAMDACAWLIDGLKVRVPIWKKEVYADEAAAWKQNPEAGVGLFPSTK